MNMLRFVSLLFVSVVLFLGSEILVSVKMGRMDLGIAVISGVARVISCVDASLFWVYQEGTIR